MAWRGSSSPKDRIFACLPYVLPLIEVATFGTAISSQVPIIATIYFTGLAPFLAIYGFLGTVIPYLGLVIFFALFLLVVRNDRIRHFIRYNTMQAILISIALSLCSLLLELFSLVGSSLADFSLFGDVILNLIFISVVSASVYSIVQCIRGRYPEIPILSEAVYTQVR